MADGPSLVPKSEPDSDSEPIYHAPPPAQPPKSSRQNIVDAFEALAAWFRAHAESKSPITAIGEGELLAEKFDAVVADLKSGNE